MLAPAGAQDRESNNIKDGRMPRGQGRHFSTETIEKIKRLLATTDLSIPAIAERMACSKSTIASLNDKYRIRAYDKKRSSWTVNHDFRRKA